MGGTGGVVSCFDATDTFVEVHGGLCCQDGMHGPEALPPPPLPHFVGPPILHTSATFNVAGVTGDMGDYLGQIKWIKD